jgi:preprotein translocase subunit SecE
MADQKPEKQIQETPVSSQEPRGVTAGKGRATPSRRQLEELHEEPERNFFMRLVHNLREYFAGVRTELTKVTWPTREDTRRLTIIVIIALIVSSIILGLIAFAFTQLFGVGLQQPIILLFIMLGGAALGLVIARMVRVRSTTY